MNFERKRAIGISEANKLLDYLERKIKLRRIEYGPGKKYKTKEIAMHSEEYTSLMGCYLITQTQSKVTITTSWWVNKTNRRMRPADWIVDLNGSESFEIQGFRTYSEFNKAAKIPETDYGLLVKDPDSGKYINSAKQILGVEKDDGQLHIEHNAYEYDLNSAFSSIILGKIPDLTKPMYNKIVKANEIGFLTNKDLSLCENGMYADIAFPLIDCPEQLKEYIMRWYEIKKSAETRQIKEKAKAYLNYPIGYIQRKNPFFRAYVVHSCNKAIQKILSCNRVLLWNTDAVITDKPLDLDLGNGIGQWKYEKIEELRYIGMTYQIDDELPKFRGLAKSWFANFSKINKRPWKLGLDPNPTNLNSYELNWEAMKIEEKKYE